MASLSSNALLSHPITTFIASLPRKLLKITIYWILVRALIYWNRYYQNVSYWGQDGHVRDLINYCNPSSRIDIIVLSFLYRFGNGNSIPSDELGVHCRIGPNGEPQEFQGMASAINTCKSHGIKVIVSLGDSVDAYSLSSQAEVEAVGQHLWEAYGNTRGSVPRPFGTTFVDGWDFDIEAWSGNVYYQYLIAKLRSAKLVLHHRGPTVPHP